MSLGYHSGAGMGSSKHEELSVRKEGEGREYLLRLGAERAAPKKRTEYRASVYQNVGNGWETVYSEWLPYEEAYAWQKAQIERAKLLGDAIPSAVAHREVEPVVTA